jgi:hypothetical protein
METESLEVLSPRSWRIRTLSYSRSLYRFGGALFVVVVFIACIVHVVVVVPGETLLFLFLRFHCHHRRRSCRSKDSKLADPFVLDRAFLACENENSISTI